MGLTESETGGEYELDDDENDEVTNVATHAIGWGAVCIAAGAACLVAIASPALGAYRAVNPRVLVPAGIVELSLGLTFVLAGLRFRAAVTTRGRDIANVMVALRYLSGALLVQIVVAAVTVLAIAGGLVASFLGK